MNKPIEALPLPVIDVEPKIEEGMPAETRRLTRLGLWAIGLGFGGFLLWAAFAPLDEGVPTTGTVAVDTKRKSVQHLQGGIIREVLVREGDPVTAGQVLFRLEDAVPRANWESVRQRYLGLRATEGRLVAEQTGAATIVTHPELEAAAASDPVIRQHVTIQTQLLQSRRAALNANLNAIDQAIQGQQSLIEGYRSVLVNRNNQRALLERELKGVRDLVAEGYAPLNRQMEVERSVAEVSSAIADVQANIARAQSGILEMRQRAEALRSEYRRDVDTQIADARREVQGEAEKYRALTEELARTEIRSPATGHVVGLAVQTVGGVITPGQKLMDIVPKNETLVLEAQVPPALIDQIQAGAPVDVRFSTFAHSPQLVVDGKVDSISADILADPSGKFTFYLARISITPEGMKTLGKRQLQPGMPVEVVIKTGERSLLTYLLHPLTKRVSASMKEQ